MAIHQDTVLIVLVYLLLSYAHSCSPVLPSVGEKYIDNAQLLTVNDINLDSVLLTIGIGESSSTFCKQFNVEQDVTSDQVSCDGDNVRQWDEKDTDPTNTAILSVSPSMDDQTFIINMQRNDQSFMIENVSYDRNITHIWDQFLFFTLNSLNSTILMISSGYYESPNLYSIAFETINENDKYSVYVVNIFAPDWRDIDMAEPDDRSVAVYESLNLLQFPLVCCLCDNSFVASYSLSVGDADYNLSTTSILYGGTVDIKGQRVFQVSYQQIVVYDVETAERLTYHPNLDLAPSHFFSLSVLVFFSVSICIV